MMTVSLTGLQITVQVLWYFTDNCYKFTYLLRSPSQRSLDSVGFKGRKLVVDKKYLQERR